MATFPERLKHLRKLRNLTQEELAKKVSVNKQTISRYELGKRRPDFDTLEKLCDIFNVSSDYMLGNVDTTMRIVDDADLNKLEGTYYNNPTVRAYVDLLHKSPQHALLLEASRDLRKKDLDFILEMIERFSDHDE